MLMVRNQQIKSNIWKYYLASTLAYFAFFTPIIQLFYLDHKLTITQIALLGVTWGVVRIILEVPSGILADKWGRKRVFAISSLFAILQVLTLIYATTFWHFFLASIFFGISFSFLSGTNISLFYDTLKQIKREAEFEKLWARQEIYQQISLVVAFLSSGFLYKFSPLLPFQLSLIFLIVSFIVVLTFKEPEYHKQIEETNVFTHFTSSMKFIFENDSLRNIMIFSVIFCIGSDLSYYYGQIYLKQLALPIVLFGIVYTLKSLLCATFANIAPFIRKRIDYRGIFALQIILVTSLLYIMVLTNNYFVGAVCFASLAIPYGLFTISKDSYIHKLTKSHRRATVDSMISFVIALVILILEPVTGYLADLYTMKLPFLLIAILMSVYCLYYLFYVYKRI